MHKLFFFFKRGLKFKTKAHDFYVTGYCHLCEASVGQQSQIRPLTSFDSSPESINPRAVHIVGSSWQGVGLLKMLLVIINLRLHFD